MSLGLADYLNKKKDYEAALLNINASLLSTYFKTHPKFDSRLTKLQAVAWAGEKNYLEAKKSYLRAMQIFKDGSDYNDYWMLGSFDYKLGNKDQAVKNYKIYIDLANKALEKDNDNPDNDEIVKDINDVKERLKELAS